MPPFVTLITATMRLRSVTVWLLVSVTTGGVGLLLGPALLGGPGRTFIDVLTWGCAAAGLVAVTVTWGIVSEVTGRVLVGTLPPCRGGPLRMLVLLACGIAVIGPPATAHSPADPEARGETYGDRSVRVEERPSSPLSGLPLPDRPGTVATRSVHTAAAPAAWPTVVVQDGDHLWGIAREQLGPEATDAEVVRLVRELHRHNATVIGPDPDLVLPGQHLALPPSHGRDHS